MVIAKQKLCNETFPWWEAAEERRIRDVDLNIGFIYNYPTLIPLIVRISFPWWRVLVRKISIVAAAL